ncbi:hypothetical protein EPUS_03149 [Endocarpon pusillum Z07020]|uniref:Endonuclease/exonuclease/phosphatase domain-containing protein n=1 Tax=Endocarpon pusillum (strain Z07020 / HMAS-L-300199) TaxID=1263415 RepID=U1GN18_ENDPU|nr:uncharacterized protein EPUS_03149 [Endocarpon pusillum Z07020]ERF73316.1 hypothetical protein EPUS_03149 [Endocarpon pusillum Z07020]
MKLLLLLSFLTAASCVSIFEITGDRFISPLRGQRVSNVTGIVTAKGPDGFWLRSVTPDRDASTSESIYVFGRTAATPRTVGEQIVLSTATVTEFRTSADYLYLTELTNPGNVTVISSGNDVSPIVIGARGLNPPTEQYSSLDNGDVFGLPNNVSQISVVNPVLEPQRYGLDFWESLTGELVSVPGARAVARPNRFGDTWVVGDWRTTGENERGGLTMTDQDANPEAILIGTPLDGSRNPSTTVLGDSFEDITGIVTQAFGFYRILPLTSLVVISSPQPALPPPTELTYSGNCGGLTIGSYNVENLSPTSPNLNQIASDIVNYLRSPPLIFIQEIQDDNGPTNDAIVSANLTLSTLSRAITAINPSASYAFTNIDPTDDTNGGQPGGNIRTAYLFDPRVLRLRSANPGTATSANEVLPGPTLRFNPGLIDPLNPAWVDSRKPLVAEWEILNSTGSFFTVNVHFASKGGSSSLHGDARPPVNGGVDIRLAQANITANFIASILAQNSNAPVIASGDFNEFAFVAPLESFVEISGLRDADVLAGLSPEERYTYLFDMNTQQLDHTYVSRGVRNVELEHVHINTWGANGASDHDPTVLKVGVCAR